MLLESGRDERQQHAALLRSANLDDGARFQLLCKALAEDPVVLVLDDFEQNLAVGGGAFLDPDVLLLLRAAGPERGAGPAAAHLPPPRAGHGSRPS